MNIKIVKWHNANTVLWQGEAEDVRAAVVALVASGANLRGADLHGAENVRLPTGETWHEYLTETVPALLTAGGKSLESFAEHFVCHSWDNCPMAHAFDAHGINGVPVLLRPRAEQFIQFFDAGQIPWPLPTKDAAK